MAEYISRDDISEFADYNKPDESDYFGTGIAERMRLDAIKELCEELDKLPFVEIEEEPIKHSHWVLNPNGTDWGIPAWCCAGCGSKNDALPTPTSISDVTVKNVKFFAASHYCPCCGAKMDEEVEQSCAKC